LSHHMMIIIYVNFKFDSNIDNMDMKRHMLTCTF
jgi:hypothetical protein